MQLSYKCANEFFNWKHVGTASTFPSSLAAQRANLRRRLAPIPTRCQTKTEVILFSSTHVNEARGKSHHPRRTSERVREIAAYFLPKHNAGIIDHSPLYPSIPSAVLPYVRHQRGNRQMRKCLYFPHLQMKSAGASRRDICQVEQPHGRATFPASPMLPYLIPADRVRWWPCQPVPLIFFK